MHLNTKICACLFPSSVDLSKMCHTDKFTPVVVGKLNDKVVIFGAVAYHRFGPLAIIGAVTGGLAAFFEFFVS